MSIYSVKELSTYLRQAIEARWRDVQVRGEVCTSHLASSGHQYITLKEDDCILDAVCWKNNRAEQSKLVVGAVVVLTGTLSTYPRTSRYQMIISGVGVLDDEAAILRALRALEVRLRLEGVFASSRPLPAYPGKIGIVTSLDGAVLEDMRRQFERCVPTEVVVHHATVQGGSAVVEMIVALDALVALGAEVIVLARGGGSITDLLPFSDERVVRAVAACPVPTISAIGHETDVLLCDHAADVRAPTPTAAPLLALPLRADVVVAVDTLLMRALERISSHCAQCDLHLEHASQAISALPATYELYAQNLAILVGRARDRMHAILSTAPPIPQMPLLDFGWIESIVGRLPSLDPVRTFERGLMEAERLASGYNPADVLRQGFAMVRTTAGKYITESAGCVGRVEVVFGDGVVTVVRE